MPIITDFREGQHGHVTGVSSSPHGTAFTRLAVTVATVSPPDAEDAAAGRETCGGYVKFWPDDDRDPQLPPHGNGKLWFPVSQISEWIPGEAVSEGVKR